MLISLFLGLASAIAFLMLLSVRPQAESRILALGLMVAAVIYVGFAVIGGAHQTWVKVEITGVGIYGLFALLGWRYSCWWLMLGWLLHPIWDVWLHLFAKGTDFTPAGYAVACISFALVIAGYISGTQWGWINAKTAEVTHQ